MTVLSRLFASRDEFRQVAALPLRRAPDGTLLVGLVTSRDTGRWIPPKGWPKAGKAAHVVAAEEAREEGGLVGRIEEQPGGIYHYRKKLHFFASVTCAVDVYFLHDVEQLATWPEQRERRVGFFPPEEAASLVAEPELAEIIRNLATA